jgi:hypothetical protein
MDSIKVVGAALVVALGSLTTQVKHKEREPNIDGASLRGYESAVAYLRKNATKERPFVLENYVVSFEKGYRYYFQVKGAPGEKPKWPGLSTDLGTTVRVYVDGKTFEVKEAVVE